MPIACAHARVCRPDARIRVSPPAVRTAVAPNGRPTVLVAEKLGAGGVEMLKDVADVKTALNMSKEELLDVISQADALVIRSATKARPVLFVVGRGVGKDVSIHRTIQNAAKDAAPNPMPHIVKYQYRR